MAILQNFDVMKKKPIADSDSAGKNYIEATGFILVQSWLLTCVIDPTPPCESGFSIEFKGLFSNFVLKALNFFRISKNVYNIKYLKYSE